ncbi:M6 family metalloprotease domain-containing protein [Candidatus Sumerlaeota bacterium]|nr:M6 family metalloprotease domain-containing protein [Candidatus Sumerlaeota bacterium]
MQKGVYRKFFLGVTVFILIVLSLAPFALSMPKPELGEMERYIQDGSYEKRLEFARSLNNHKTHPDLIQRKMAQMQAEKEGRPFDLASFPYATGLPASGSPDIFVLLIEFPDYLHTNTDALINAKIFGYGETEDEPYESLSEYYRRSSYDALFIQGHVFPWYKAANNRNYYSGNSKALIKEALDYFNPTHDFSTYDNNGDGKIDFFGVLYTGPDTGWGTFWWAWCDIYGSHFSGDPYSVDGKTIGVYCFQWECNPVGTEFAPRIMIHETGHGLGLQDYYDYEPATGPRGGLGQLDMMDGNWGDHNAFSKWLLGWITPTTSGSWESFQDVFLRPSSSFKDCVAIMPGLPSGDPFREYFMIQNRSPLGNDSDYPSEGLVIWHVDARLNVAGNNFQFNNSNTSHKLLRLMEADGLEEIETIGDSYKVEACDYYVNGKELTPLSVPKSHNYAGGRTGVHAINIYPTGIASFYRATFDITSYDLTSLGIAVDNAHLIWHYGGSLPWYGQFLKFYYGGNAAQSPYLSNNQNAYFGTIFTGPTSVSFQWKVSSEESGDFLEFYVDGALEEQISGEVDWSQVTYDLTAGSHNLQWKYAKNGANASGMDRGFVDRIHLSNDSIGEAVDNTFLSWNTRGDPLWHSQNTTYFFGNDAAQTNIPGDVGEKSFLETSVIGPGELSFYWLDDTAKDVGELSFRIDGKHKNWMFNWEWEQKTYSIGSGVHILNWEYKKWIDEGDPDHAWVDRVEYTRAISLNEAVDNYDKTFATYGSTGSAGWYGQEKYYNWGFDSAQSGPISHNQNSFLETTVNGPCILSFRWKVSSETNHDYLEFAIDGYGKEQISGWIVTRWSQKNYLLESGSHDLRWLYWKDGAGSESLDCGWVDKIEIAPTPSLGEAVDNTSLSWDTAGFGEWLGQPFTSYYGGDAAQSGEITHSQYARIYTTVEGPGMLRFYWKVSCEPNFDSLKLYIEGAEVAKISGDVDWNEMKVHIGAGEHDIAWWYAKDASFSDNEDCGWVDKVEFTPASSGLFIY